MAEPPRPDDQQPITNSSATVAMGPIRRDLTHLFQMWSNDFEVRRFMGPMRPTSLESIEDMYASIRKDENQSYFTVYEKSELRPIGNAGLEGIDHAHGTAEFFIEIGDKESWGKGYGTEVTRLVLEYGFICLACTTSVSEYTPKGPASGWPAVYGKQGGGPDGPTIFY